MKKQKMRRWLSLMLTVCLCAGLLAPASAVQTSAAPESESETADQSSGHTYKNSLRELVGQQFAGQLTEYDQDDVVSVIVQLDAPALLDDEYRTMLLSDGGDIADVDTRTLSMAQDAVEEIQQEVMEQVSLVSGASSLENSESFTLLLNAFTAEVPYSQLSAISAIPGVRNVFVNGSFSIPVTTPGYTLYTDSSSAMIGLDEVEALGYTGEGTVIAILDTGIDYSHEAFATSPENPRYTQAAMKALVTEKGDLLQAKITAGWDMTTYEPIYENLSPAELMISDKIIYSFDYANVDYDATADIGEHGIHVAGIAAGNTVNAAGECTFHGAAPDAQLAIMKVFNSWSGACATSTLLAALEDCVLLDVDVINMSLGTASGFATDVSGILSEVMEKIENAGIILAVAAGNDTHSAGNNPVSDTKLPQVANPDYGLVASPSTYHAAFSVASVNNDLAQQSYLLLNDRKALFADSMEDTIPITSIGSLEVVSVPGVGDVSDYDGLDVTGKAVLVQRGTISFSDKLSNAAARGALALLVYDNEESDTLISMSLENPTIPSAFLFKADGEAVLDMLSRGETVTLSASVDYKEFITYADAGMMSSFSSWGAGSTLSIKPEITAPGGNIYSSVANNSYESMSGTSMASPEIAGAAAVLTQYLKAQSPDLSKCERASLLYALMMSTADPVAAENGLPASVRQQGAGLVNVKDAISSAAVLFADAQGSRPKAELGSSESGSYQFTFVVENLSDEPLQYTADVSVLTDTATTVSGVSYFSGVPQDISDGAQVRITAQGALLPGDVNFDGVVNSSDARAIRRHISGIAPLSGNALAAADVNGSGSVTAEDASLILASLAGLRELPTTLFIVPAGESLSVTVSIQLTGEEISALSREFPCGAFIEGYVTLTAAGENEDLSYPYLGFLGDWEDQQIFDSTYYDSEAPMVYDSYAVAINAWGSGGNYLGFNYFTQSFDGDKLYFSPSAFGAGSTYLYSEISLLRNVENMTFTVSDADTGTTLYTTTQGNAGKTYYNIAASTPGFANTGDPVYDTGYGEQTFQWPEDGGHLLYTASASHEGDESAAMQSITFPVITMDSTAPTFTYDVAYSEESGTFDLTLHMTDNGHIQGARISGIHPVNQWFSEVVEVAAVSSSTITEAAPGTTVSEVIHLPELQKVLAENDCELDKLVIEVVDYAWNITELEITLTGSHFTTADNADGTVTITRYAGVSESVEIPGIIGGKTVTAIGEDAFADSALKSVTIPDSVTSIGAGAFHGTALSYVKVPAAVTFIGEKAFGYDTSGEKLADFTMCVLAGSAAEAYAAANGFAMEYFTENGMIYKIASDADTAYISVTGYDGTDGTLDIPASIQGVPVEEIGYRAFLENTVLTSVTLPEGLKRICNRAFMYTNVGNMVLPSTLEVIEEGAFAQMPNLTAIEIPAGVKELPYMVFAHDVNLTSVKLNEGLEKFGGDVFMDTGLTEITLPDSLTDLGECVFQDCTKLASVKFPAGLTKIPSGTFFNTGFTEVVIPDGVTEIAATAFASCKNLVSLTIPASVVTLGMQWGSGAFNSCTSLTTVTFTGERTEPLMIGGGTFQDCSALKTIDLPDCSYIGYGAFTMSGLTSISIPGSCKELGMQVFYMCASLESITFNEGTETLGSMLLTSCPKVKEVTIPRSVTTIQDMALGFLNWSEKVEGFTIHGYAGTAAETYANANGFTFVAISE